MPACVPSNNDPVLIFAAARQHTILDMYETRASLLYRTMYSRQNVDFSDRCRMFNFMTKDSKKNNGA